MLRNIKLVTKLALAFFSIALIFFISSSFFLMESRRALSTSVFNQLESVRESKKARVEDFFAERESDMHVLLNIINFFQQSAFQQVETIKHSKKSQLEQYFQERLYDITTASQSLAIAEALQQFDQTLHQTAEERKSAWSTLEKKFAVELNKFKEKQGYSNLFLIATDGDVAYSTSEQLGVGKNILQGKLKDSFLTQIFQQGLKEVSIQDFTLQKSLESKPPVLFLAAPVALNTDLLGVLVLGIVAEPINAIVSQQNNPKQREEVYLVGAQNGLVSYRNDKILSTQKVYSVGDETKGGKDIEQALAGQSGTEIQIDANNQVKITSYAPLAITGLNWGIIVTVGLAESISPVQNGEKEDFLANYIKYYDYYDLFLIHPQGYIFYTVKHEKDYQSNILTGEYAQSGLGQLVQSALSSKAFAMSDYAPYAPSNGEPAAFIAEPLVNGDKVEMIVALQLGDKGMNRIMHERTGMGESGEAYLVGGDKLMRSNSYHDQVHRSIIASFANPAKGSVDTEGSRAALAGETGTDIIQDYRDVSVLSAYTPVKVGNLIWGLLVEIDEAEAFAAINQLELTLGIVAVLGVITIIVIAWWITNTIRYPLTHLVEISKAIATGNLNNDIQIKNHDEIGQLLQAFAAMQTQLREHLEQEVKEIISSISQGDFDRRLNLEGKGGFFWTLSESINQIIQINQEMITETMRVFAALSQGDLTQTIAGNYMGSFEQLKNDANATVAHLTEIMTAIQQMANEVNVAADELSQGNINLSQRTEQQAASLQQTAASMEQMTGTVQQNTDNTKQAAQLAHSATDRAKNGCEIVNSAIVAITAINKSSKKIKDIIGVIDEIAFQTNLLALNAAVEAARAGEQGRGFAVVATEVRALAQRSAVAAKEIKELIQDSVIKVEEGVQLANQSGDALEEIVTAVKKVNDIIAEIAAAGQEQSAGINQVNKAVSQMDEMTQKNASMVEETATASESLSRQAQNLKRQIAFFKLDQQPTPQKMNRNKPKMINRSQSPLPNQSGASTTPPTHHYDNEWEEF